MTVLQLQRFIIRLACLIGLTTSLFFMWQGFSEAYTRFDWLWRNWPGDLVFLTVMPVMMFLLLLAATLAFWNMPHPDRD
jgi:hypothetical protein